MLFVNDACNNPLLPKRFALCQPYQYLCLSCNYDLVQLLYLLKKVCTIYREVEEKDMCIYLTNDTNLSLEERECTVKFHVLHPASQLSVGIYSHVPVHMCGG